MSIRPVDVARIPELESLLLRDPTVNVFPLDALEWRSKTSSKESRGFLPPGYEFFGLFAPVSDTLDGAAFVISAGSLVVPCAEPKVAAALGAYFAKRIRIQRMVGALDSVDALWEAYGGARPRLFRVHRLYGITGELLKTKEPPSILRTAQDSDLPRIIEMSRAMHIEELGIDPIERDQALFERSVTIRTARRAIYVITEGDQVVFKAEVGAASKYGAQIEGVYTVPEYRGRGLATRALADLVRRLLVKTPRITLHVHETNEGAMRVYERVGFRPVTRFRLISD